MTTPHAPLQTQHVVLMVTVVLVYVALSILWGNYRRAQKVLDEKAGSRNPYEWMVDWSYYIAVVAAVVYTVLLLAGVVAHLRLAAKK